MPNHTSLPPHPAAQRRSSDSACSAQDAKRTALEAQALADAKLDSFFGATGGAQGGFDYLSSTVEALESSASALQAASPAHAQHLPPAPRANGAFVNSYAEKMQRGGLIQSFGCVLVLEEGTFNLLAYSENAPQMLGLQDPASEEETEEAETVGPLPFSSSLGEDLTPLEALKPTWKQEETTKDATKDAAGDTLRRGNSVGAALLQIGARIRRALAPRSGSRARRTNNEPASPSLGGGTRQQNSSWSGNSNLGTRTPSRRSMPPHQRSPEEALEEPPATLQPPAATRQLPTLEPVKPQQPSLALGSCVLPVFTTESALNLQHAMQAQDLRILNPLLLQSLSSTGQVNPFFAILHRTDVGLHMDLEPIRPEDAVLVTGQGAMHANRLASRAISRLEKVPAGNLPLLFDTVAREVKALTGFDRVVAYRFHEDYHGEVIAEVNKETMDPLLGLHYPPTDIPLVWRLMFLKNKVRVIVDSTEPPVKVLQLEATVEKPVVLAHSNLRAVHECHVKYMSNLGIRATLVLSVVVNDHQGAMLPPPIPGQEPGSRLWGLVVCHHETAKLLPYPLRLACEFLIQVFSLRVNMEMEMESLERQKHALKLQASLTDMLLRDPLHTIATQRPNFMDLLPCEGAALLFQGSFFTLGNTPTPPQMLDILQWIRAQSPHEDAQGSSVFSTDSLKESGYPYSHHLRNTACGLLAAPFGSATSQGGCVFWFRAPIERSLRWAGLKNQPGCGENGDLQHPRSSFKAFLEVVKDKAMKWDDLAVGAARSLSNFLSQYRSPASSAAAIPQEKSYMQHASASLAEIKATAGLETYGRLSQPRDPSLEDAAGVHDEELEVDILEPSLPSPRIKPSSSPSGPLSLSLSLSNRSFPVSPSAQRKATYKIDGFQPSSFNQGSARTSAESLGESPPRKAAALQVVTVSRGGRLATGPPVETAQFPGELKTQPHAPQDGALRSQGDHASTVHSRQPLIPPIFGVDDAGRCMEWNPAMEVLTGVERGQALGKLLVGEVFSGALVMRDESRLKLQIGMAQGLAGLPVDKGSFSFNNCKGEEVEVLLTVRAQRDPSTDEVTGCNGFLHCPSAELLHALKVHKEVQRLGGKSLAKVQYLRDQIRGPMSGMQHVKAQAEQDLPEDEDTRKLFAVGLRCMQQVTRILSDDIGALEEGFLGMESDDFKIADIVDVVASIAREASARRNVELKCQTSADLAKAPPVRGDALRLQQALADLLTSAIRNTPEGGWVQLTSAISENRASERGERVGCEFRVLLSNPEGMPSTLLDCLLTSRRAPSGVNGEGMGLYIGRKIVEHMDGDVRFYRMAAYSEMVVRVQFSPSRKLQ